MKVFSRIVVIFALISCSAVARRNQARKARHGNQTESGPAPKPQVKDAGPDIVGKVIEFGPIDNEMYEAQVKSYIEPGARTGTLKASHEIIYDGGVTEEVLITDDPRGSFYNHLKDAYGHEVIWKLQRTAAQRKDAWRKKVMERDPSGASLPHDFTPLFPKSTNYRFTTSRGKTSITLKCCCPDEGRPSYNTCRFMYEPQSKTFYGRKKTKKCSELVGSDSYNSWEHSPKKHVGKGRGNGAGKCIATLSQMQDAAFEFGFTMPTLALKPWTGD
eukprot:gnl/MRDRNA2_/MRDRNA2_144544_c0_seq1.p1 gnl/MRDRNA2_/MRDRNA2_144544_c0~~gnl/MRDRNA2_/MRDRNA2_144544_c0_seq1.p1  ORF type:complete len:273 (+),score=43.50 gnl/MRDRNA2_/MRDRNA2_144544_c0_seq1:90-908(+)